MKGVDLFLLSLALGLTLLNALVLSSDYPREFAETPTRDPLAPDVAKSRAYRAIVIHDLDRPHEGFPFHFVIGDGTSFPDGAVVPTDRWRRQEGDRVEIALAGLHTERQEAALLDLLARLRRDYAVADVGTHRELDAASGCPKSVDIQALRGRLP